MNNAYWLRSFCCAACVTLLVPAICSAQLSSTNYQVEVFGVGEERGGTAASTQYRVDGVVGSPLEYSPASVTPAVADEDLAGGGRRIGADPEGVGDMSSVTEATAPPLPVGLESLPDAAPVPAQPLEVSELPLPDGSGPNGVSDPEPDSSAPVQETTAGTPDTCTGLVDCYGWPLALMTVMFVALFFYFRRAS